MALPPARRRGIGNSCWFQADSRDGVLSSGIRMRSTTTCRCIAPATDSCGQVAWPAAGIARSSPAAPAGRGFPWISPTGPFIRRGDSQSGCWNHPTRSQPGVAAYRDAVSRRGLHAVLQMPFSWPRIGEFWSLVRSWSVGEEAGCGGVETGLRAWGRKRVRRRIN